MAIPMYTSILMYCVATREKHYENLEEVSSVEPHTTEPLQNFTDFLNKSIRVSDQTHTCNKNRTSRNSIRRVWTQAETQGIVPH